MREIPLTRGFVALVDDEDYERVSKYKWWASQQGEFVYAKTTIYERNGPSRKMYMHRFILNAKRGEYVDHRNHRTLDNRRCEIRLTTQSNNCGNMRVRTTPTKTSRFKGVSWSRDCRKWQVHIRIRNYAFGKVLREERTALEARNRNEETETITVSKEALRAAISAALEEALMPFPEVLALAKSEARCVADLTLQRVSSASSALAERRSRRRAMPKSRA